MKVAVEQQGPCRVLLRVDYTAEEVQKEYDDSLAIYAKHGTVKGFRPGRAPREMIRRQYDKQILEGLRDHLLAKGYQQAVKEHGIEPVAETNLEQAVLQAGQPFTFSVTLEVEPTFEMPAYKGLAVEARKVEIAEEAVTQALDRYLESMGKYEDVAEERPVAAGDMVAVDYTATVDGRPMAEVSEKAKGLATGTDFWVIANEEYSFLPGFGPQLAGLKAGESKDIEVVFDGQSPIEELRGKTGVFATTVKKLRARRKPALDEALFRSLNVKDEAELRETFRGLLAREAESQERSRRRNEVLDGLMKSVAVEVPETETRTEANRIVYEMVQENARRGVPEQEIRDHLEKITESAQAAARDRVKLRYLLRGIAREEKLVVTDAEVTALMNAQAQRSGAKSVREWLQRAKLQEKEVRGGLRQDLLTSKTIDVLLAHAKWTGEGAAAEAAAASGGEKTEEKA